MPNDSHSLAKSNAPNLLNPNKTDSVLTSQNSMSDEKLFESSISQHICYINMLAAL